MPDITSRPSVVQETLITNPPTDISGLVPKTQIGTATGQIPVIPVLMAQMSTPVKSTIDAITAQGGPAWIASISAPNKAGATVDFGYAGGNGEGDYATTTVSASWVTSTSRIICRCAPADSLDHTTDETIAEGITFDAVNIVPGTSFDVKSFAPSGTWGRHDCTIIGL